MPYHILHVEDEVSITELIRDILSHPEIKLTAVLDGSQGFGKAEQIKPDLFILDVNMPDSDGWDLYRQLRASEAFKHKPIIMLTGQGRRYRIMKDFAGSPIDAYIAKPFNAGDLWLHVERMLGQPLWTARLGMPTATNNPK